MSICVLEYGYQIKIDMYVSCVKVASKAFLVFSDLVYNAI